ncbi:hypothetical protein BH10PSE17_BH10PSE17_10530 [soil metagenome]
MASIRRTVQFLSAAVALCVALPASAAEPLTIPDMVYRERVLANGLRVISVEGHDSPTVAIQLWYQVGSKDDPQGRSGFAHLFEHLMFKSTKYLQSEQFDRLTEDVGGSNNAGTADDYTNYHEVVPANYLEPLLWAEAERMTNLQVNQANFVSERSVVEEEYRQRVLAAPYGALSQAIERDSYRVHPYRRPGIGNIDELEAASLDDVVAFHSTYYRPDNATLVVSGDFDPAQLDGWVDKYFGVLAKPDRPLPRVTTVEPPWPDDRVFDETGTRVPLPAVALTWLGPRAVDDDAAALTVASALLDGGDSSRLYESMVYRDRSAAQVSFNADLRAGPGLLTALAVAAQGRSLDELVAGLKREIARLAKGPITKAELDKVKTQMLTSALLARQTPNGRASDIGSSVLIEGDAARVNTDLKRLQAVTAADVQRVVKRYLIDAHHNRINYRQAAAPKDPK